MTHGTALLNFRRAALAGAAALALVFTLPAAAAQADDDFERGKQLLAQGDAKGATAALKRAAERRKTDADAWYAYGLALGRTGKQKDARKAFERAVKLRPEWATARASLAYTLTTLNKMDDAEREARHALALDPKSPDAHYVVAHINYLANDFKSAAAEAEAALALTPDFPAAAFLYGDALINIYIAEGERQANRYPLPPGANEAQRMAVFERRDAAVEPFKARMRATAERLDALARTRAGAEAQSLSELADSLRIYGREGAENQRIFRATEVSQRVVILSKPEPGYTEEARKSNVSGTVRLRAVLAADGRVRNVAVIKRLPGGLTEKCVAMARQIRFTPAMVNGTPVSQYVVLEYNFNIY
ncbi:MAG TPA: TonB family protein [Pyrinomonadaceae bacterium]